METAPSLGSVGSAAAAAPLQRPASTSADVMPDASGLSDSIMSMLQLNDSQPPSATSASAADSSSLSMPRPPSRPGTTPIDQQPFLSPAHQQQQHPGHVGTAPASAQPQGLQQQQQQQGGGGAFAGAALPAGASAHNLAPSRPQSVASSSRGPKASSVTQSSLIHASRSAS